MSLRVLRISAGATLQDAGRPGWRRFGVPPGGAFDRESLRLGNALIGNDEFAPGIEMALFGGRFEAASPLRIAVVGAEGAVRTIHCGQGREIGSNACFEIGAGETLEIGAFKAGVRAHLCVGGGFVAESILGSLSGVPVGNGDSFEASTSGRAPRPGIRRLANRPPMLDSGKIRIISAESISKDSHRRLCNTEFRVSTNSDRRGIRLDGDAVDEADERPSEPECVGAVQLTPSGQLLVLGPDGPTIGGYPKVGVVVSADLDRIAQLAPGDAVRFEPVSLDTAIRLKAERESRIRREIAELRAALGTQ